MLRKHCTAIIAAGILYLFAAQADAYEAGLVLARNILCGAASGAAVGLAAGTLAYGLDNNYHAEYLLTGAVYGLVGGVLLGSGMTYYEISSQKTEAGCIVAGYLAGGTGIGALLGGVVAAIPFMRDKDPEDFTIGLGLGGLIGAALGLVAATIDVSARDNQGKAMLSGKVGLVDFSAWQPNSGRDPKSEPLYTCELVRLAY